MNLKIIKLMALAALVWSFANQASAALAINLNVMPTDPLGSSGWNGKDDIGVAMANVADSGNVTSGSLTFSAVIGGSDAGIINDPKTGTVGGAQNSDVVFNSANLKISAVPEPINVALAAFGLVFAGFSVGRHYLHRQRILA